MFTRPGRLAGALLLLAPLGSLSFPSLSAAHDPLRCEMKAAAEELRNYFGKLRIKEITVGEVHNADPTTPSTTGPGIRRVLVQELERAELKVKDRGEVGLSVTYWSRKKIQKDDRKAERLIVEVRLTATFKADSTQQDALTHTIEDEEAVRHILGLTGTHTSPEGKARDKETVLALTNPRASFNGSVILAGEKSPFGVEILVDDKPVRPTDRDNLGRVDLRRDQTYAIRLVNHSPLEVAVRLSIDGLNLFSFSELRHEDGPYKGTSLYDMVLVPPRDSVTIKGWHRNNATSWKFKITDYADTAAAKMGKATDIGTITATFSATWEKTPPDDEPNGARAPGDAGTGFGAPTTMKYTAVRRTIGAVRASVAVLYKVPPAE